MADFGLLQRWLRGVGIVGQVDGHDVIRRDSMNEMLERWIAEEEKHVIHRPIVGPPPTFLLRREASDGGEGFVFGAPSGNVITVSNRGSLAERILFELAQGFMTYAKEAPHLCSECAESALRLICPNCVSEVQANAAREPFERDVHAYVAASCREGGVRE